MHCLVRINKSLYHEATYQKKIRKHATYPGDTDYHHISCTLLF